MKQTKSQKKTWNPNSYLLRCQELWARGWELDHDHGKMYWYHPSDPNALFRSVAEVEKFLDEQKAEKVINIGGG